MTARPKLLQKGKLSLSLVSEGDSWKQLQVYSSKAVLLFSRSETNACKESRVGDPVLVSE